MKKISVIIPVYNSEKYIEQCVNSLINQTYGNWEALLIDDGSVDGSLEKCLELNRKDSRIKVYCQENKGPSAARNYGLDLSDGDFVFFLDSDDALHPLLFEEMINQTKLHGVKMAYCSSVRLDDSQMNDTLLKASQENERPKWAIADGEVSERWFHVDYLDSLHSVGGLILKELIGDLRFDETLSMGEDGLFKYYLFEKKVPCAYSSVPWYYYRKNNNGLCNDTELVAREEGSEKAIRIRDNELKKGNLRYAQIWENMHTSRLRWTYELCKKEKNKELCSKIKKAALKEFSHPLFKKAAFPYRFLFNLCFKCYPLYVPALWLLQLTRVLKVKIGANR